MKHIRRSNKYRSYLYEVSRKNLVGKSKAQSPERYKRTIGYYPKSYDFDLNKLLESGELVVYSKVGDYICTVAYYGFLDTLKQVLKSQPMPNLTLQTVIKTLQRSIDNFDIMIDCECADWIYRFKYWATKYGYNYGREETRPTDETNPNDKKGSCCKHLLRLLKDKRWLVKLSSVVNSLIKQNIDDFRDAMGLSEDEMFINAPGRPSAKTNRNTRMLPKEPEPEEPEDTDDTNNDEETQDDDEEIVDIENSEDNEDEEEDEE